MCGSSFLVEGSGSTAPKPVSDLTLRWSVGTCVAQIPSQAGSLLLWAFALHAFDRLLHLVYHFLRSPPALVLYSWCASGTVTPT